MLDFSSAALMLDQSPKRIPFFNLYLDLLPKNVIKDPSLYIEKHFGDKTIHITNLNLETLTTSNIERIIQSSDLIIPDGVLVVKTYNWFFKGSADKISKIAGIDLAYKLLETKDRVALVGAKSKVIDKLKEKFGAKLVFAHHGYFDEESTPDIAHQISEAKPDLVLLALGSPKQEIFIDRYKDLFKNCICMGVGGSFDIWAEELKRAPRWMISLNLEWLFRIIQEPYRSKRLLYNLSRYLLLLTFSFKSYFEVFRFRKRVREERIHQKNILSEDHQMRKMIESDK